MGIQTWAETTVGSLQNIWGSFLGSLPALLGAVAVLVLGFLAAAFLKSLAEKAFKIIKLDSLLKKAGVNKAVQNAGYELNSGKFFGAIIYWFILVVTFLAASDILNLWGVSLFLRDIISFVPNIIAAVLIMLATVILASFLRNLVRASISSTKLHSGKSLGTLAWWATAIFGFAAALMQLGIAVNLINTMITGIVVMIALAGGIAFGLGGKDAASRTIEKIRQDISDK